VTANQTIDFQGQNRGKSSILLGGTVVTVPQGFCRPSARIAAFKRCSKCGRDLPLTEEFWYVRKTGPLRGRVTGYCRRDQNLYCRWRDSEGNLTAFGLARRRVQQRDSRRRVKGSDPDRCRVTAYETLLAAAGAPLYVRPRRVAS